MGVEGAYLLLAEQRQVEDDFQGLGVRGEDDYLADASVEGLGGLVGSLFDLLEGGSLLDDSDDLGREFFIGEG